MAIRLTGSVSGMDIDSMVKQLMKAERMPIDKLKQKKQMLEWQRDDYRDINSSLLSFRTLVSNMRQSTTYLTKKATSSDETVLSATGTANAVDGNYKIKVTQLAKSAELTSSAIGAKDQLKKLVDLGITDSKTTLTISGEKGSSTITVSNNETIGSFVSMINNQANQTGVRVSYDSAMDKLFFSSTNSGTQTKIDLSSSNDLLLSKLGLSGSAKTGSSFTGSVQFFETTKDVNGNDIQTISPTAFIDNTLTSDQTFTITKGAKTVEFTISKNTTIKKLMDQINASDLGKDGVSSYMDENGKLNFVSLDGTSLTFADGTADSQDILAKLGLPANPAFPAYNYSQISGTNGQNAKVTYNDNSDAEYSSNVFTINGMSIRANKLGEVNVTVTQDVDTAVKSIKDFVDKYNELIDKIDKKTLEKKNRDYQPLTDDQRQSLDDDQIKKWEEQARLGDLHSDSILTKVLSNMRSDLNNFVTSLSSGDIRQLSQIGIQTGAYFERGKLYIKDEAALRSALASNPEQVMRLFNYDDPTVKKSSQDGIAVRLFDRISDAMKEITDKAGAASATSDNSFVAKDLKDINKRITAMETTMTDKENRYYKKFSAMEQALSKFNSQSSSLSAFMTKN